MSKIRVLIVDDSPFSQTVIKNSLSTESFEVCAIADTGREGINAYRRVAPDVVIMDVTMPDIDGLVCSKEIIGIDQGAKIVILSAMHDENIVNRAYTIGVKACLQKPVKADVLNETLKKVHDCQDYAQDWKEQYVKHFTKAFAKNIELMAGLSYEGELAAIRQDGIFESNGVAIIIGLTGENEGRVILDASRETAERFTKKVLNKTIVSDEEILHAMAEFANIICGHGVTTINNAFKTAEIRIVPPSILYGSSLRIVNPKLQSYIIAVDTSIGRLVLNVGFLGGNNNGCKIN